MDITTVDDILSKLRSGYKQEISLKYGDYEVPCRLLSAGEERALISKAKSGVIVLNEASRDLDESLAVMKAILLAACTVDNTPRLPMGVLDRLTNVEVQALYDQYVTICHTVNPEFESLTADEVIELIKEVKKKNQRSSDLYTWQLAAIGKYFLEDFLPAVREPGS